MKKPITLTIAGSDSGGGAGIQADIKTMSMNGVFPTSVITSLTAQNTSGIKEIYEISPEFIKAQLEAVLSDLHPKAVKIGMIKSPSLVDVILEELLKYKVDTIVLDPIFSSTTGTNLNQNETFKLIIDKLFPISSLITPNIPETREILNLIGERIEINSKYDIEKSAFIIANKYKSSILIKGGHGKEFANDYLYDISNDVGRWYYMEKIDNHNTHGTGCTLSSAITANLAKGLNLEDSVEKAKEYLTGAISAMLDIGKGDGPLDHAYIMKI